MTDSATLSDDAGKYEFNEHNIRRLDVGDGTLKQHEGFDGGMSRIARELLENDAVHTADVGPVTTDLWFRDVDRMNWEPPEGYTVQGVSTFLEGDKHQYSVCVTITPGESMMARDTGQ